MLQPRFWQLMFFGLLSSFTIYSINFSGSVLPASVINPDRNLDVTTGKLHVLVTHGAGFLGSHIALALLDAGHAVTLVDDPTSRITHLYKLLKGTGRRMKVQSADLADAQQLQALLAAANPAVDAVMHLADPAGEGLSVRDPLQYLVNCTSHILALLKAIESSTVTQLVASSSYSVYGKPADSPVHESAACQPNTVQGHAAQFTESAVRTYAATQSSFKAVILRHATIMGADPQARLGSFSSASSESPIQHPADPLASCLSAAAQGLQQQPYHLLTSNSSVHSDDQGLPCYKEYIHVSDLAAAYVAVVGKTANSPRVYNAGTGQPVTYKEVLDACQRVLGVAFKVTAKLLNDDLCYGVKANVSALQTDTGWRHRYQLNESLKHAIAAVKT